MPTEAEIQHDGAQWPDVSQDARLAQEAYRCDGLKFDHNREGEQHEIILSHPSSIVVGKGVSTDHQKALALAWVDLTSRGFEVPENPSLSDAEMVEYYRARAALDEAMSGATANMATEIMWRVIDAAAKVAERVEKILPYTQAMAELDDMLIDPPELLGPALRTGMLQVILTGVRDQARVALEPIRAELGDTVDGRGEPAGTDAAVPSDERP